MDALSGDLITDQILEFGAHTRPELAFLRTIVRPGDSIFDLGAHIGTFTVPLAISVGSTGRVLAVEASPAHETLLKRNLQINGLRNVEAVRALIGPTARYVAVAVDGNSGATRFQSSPDGDAMPCLSLDELVERFFRPNLLKMDIEGLEYWTLSSSSFLAEARPALYAEISTEQLARYGASVNDIEALLKSRSYRLFRNVADRNAANDHFDVLELAALHEGGEFFDVLALHSDDPRIALLTNRS